MKLLMLGGTVFLGRHIVEAALSQCHEVTLFNRGQHNPDLFPGLERLRGDRDGGLHALRGRQWDAVIDTCGHIPRVVAHSARLLADQSDHYTFISSISVYNVIDQERIDEDSAVATMADPSVEEVTGETYGPLKALCEQAAEEAMPGRVLMVRPGLIVGPNDPTDRFTYWPMRIDRGGQILAPGPEEVPVQIIDVRDLAEWMVKLVGRKQVGLFNATGPEHPYTMDECLEGIAAALGERPIFEWVPADFLLAREVTPWTEMPLWVPDEGEWGLMRTSVAKAVSTGLQFRPLSETAQDTLTWARSRPKGHQWRAGLAVEKEARILADWFGHNQVMT